MTIILFLIVFCVFWLIIEIFSIMLKITGLELSKARFQIISILTHTGITTRESELIVQHPVRRRIASILMIVSYLAQATLITLLFDMIYRNGNNLFVVFIVLSGFLIFIIAVTRNKFILEKFESIAEKILIKRIKSIKGSRIDTILNLSPEFSVFEILIDEKSQICNKTLRETKLKENYIQVLKIDRGSEILDFPKADTQVLIGDRMIVYGKIESITKFITK